MEPDKNFQKGFKIGMNFLCSEKNAFPLMQGC